MVLVQGSNINGIITGWPPTHGISTGWPTTHGIEKGPNIRMFIIMCNKLKALDFQSCLS